MLEPYRIYWMEEVLQPHDYAGFGRLHAAIKSTRIATGEHEMGATAIDICWSTTPPTSGRRTSIGAAG